MSTSSPKKFPVNSPRDGGKSKKKSSSSRSSSDSKSPKPDKSRSSSSKIPKLPPTDDDDGGNGDGMGLSLRSEKMRSRSERKLTKEKSTRDKLKSSKSSHERTSTSSGHSSHRSKSSRSLGAEEISSKSERGHRSRDKELDRGTSFRSEKSSHKSKDGDKESHKSKDGDKSSKDEKEDKKKSKKEKEKRSKSTERDAIKKDKKKDKDKDSDSSKEKDKEKEGKHRRSRSKDSSRSLDKSRSSRSRSRSHDATEDGTKERRGRKKESSSGGLGAKLAGGDADKLKKKDSFEFDDDCSWATEQIDEDDATVEIPVVKANVKKIDDGESSWFGGPGDDLFGDESESSTNDGDDLLLSTMTPKNNRKSSVNAAMLRQSPRDQPAYFKPGVNGAAPAVNPKTTSPGGRGLSPKELLNTRNITRRNRRPSMDTIMSESERDDSDRGGMDDVSARSGRSRVGFSRHGRRGGPNQVEDMGADVDFSDGSFDADFDGFSDGAGPQEDDGKKGDLGSGSQRGSLHNAMMREKRHSISIGGGSYLPSSVLDPSAHSRRRRASVAGGGMDGSGHGPPRMQRYADRKRANRRFNGDDDESEADDSSVGSFGGDSVYSGPSLFTGVDQNYGGVDLLKSKKDKTDTDASRKPPEAKNKKKEETYTQNTEDGYGSDWSQKVDDVIKKNREIRRADKRGSVTGSALGGTGLDAKLNTTNARPNAGGGRGQPARQGGGNDERAARWNMMNGG